MGPSSASEGWDPAQWDPAHYSAQLEEVVACTSILGADDFRLIDVVGLPLEQQHDLDPEALQAAGAPDTPARIVLDVVVHVQLPDAGLQLLVVGGWPGAEEDDPGPSTSKAAEQAADHGLPFGKRVSQLPPIRLHLELPYNYPEAQAPRAQLTAMWLRPSYAAQLAAALHAQFSPGEPVLFQWVDWLRTDALEQLGVAASGTLTIRDRVLDFGGSRSGSASLDAAIAAAAASAARAAAAAAAASGEEAGGEGLSTSYAVGAAGGPAAAASSLARALSAQGGASGVQPAHETAMAIMRYAHAREADIFQTQPVTCSICFEDMLGAKCVRLPECGHYFCRDCFTQHCSTQVADGAVENVKCPDPSCRLPVTPVTLRSVLTEEEYERWEALLLQRTLDKMADVVYCPRCNSIVLEDADHCAQCTKCFFVFCSLCYGSWHPGEECMNAEAKLEALQRRGNRTGAPNAERQRLEMDLINQIKSMSTIMGTSKKCPKCQMGIEKTEGCNKMACSYCSTYFCWKCLKIIDGYDHFGAKSCALFDEAEIARWNAMQNVGDRFWEAQAANNVVDQVRRGGHGDVRIRFARCVICGQFNLKEGNNNLIRCYACTSAFCYQCRTHLHKSPGLHFGPGKKCKQHSDD